jgi:LPS sulfotransferase NodH
MSRTPAVSFDLSKLAEAKRRIPAADFSDASYDLDQGALTTDVLVVLGTPRSGSTLLCDLLRLNEACLAHEYFQPAQYMPLLAERWGCIEGNTLNEGAYVSCLRRFRTYPNGWLGINLHGSHLAYYTRMEGCLSDARLHYVHLVRRDVIRQAISYHIAAHTRQWSSEFDPEAHPEYDYAQIERKLRQVQDQNVLIQAFLLARRADYSTIYYEDFVAHIEETLRTLPCIPSDAALRTDSTLRRQSDARSADWALRFAEDRSQIHSRDHFLTRVRRLLRGT